MKFSTHKTYLSTRDLERSLATFIRLNPMKKPVRKLGYFVPVFLALFSFGHSVLGQKQKSALFNSPGVYNWNLPNGSASWFGLGWGAGATGGGPANSYRGGNGGNFFQTFVLPYNAWPATPLNILVGARGADNVFAAPGGTTR